MTRRVFRVVVGHGGVLRGVRGRARSVEQRVLLSPVDRRRRPGRPALLRRRTPALLLLHLTASPAAAAASSPASVPAAAE